MKTGSDSSGLPDLGNTVSLEFRFNEAAEVVGIYTEGRWSRTANGYELTPWQGRFSAYCRHEGMLVPSRGEVGWYANGRLEIVWAGEITSLEYEFERGVWRMKRIMLVAALVLILAAAVIYVQYRSDLAAARRELQSGSQIVYTTCGPVEYAVAGSGPAVLVIHGAGGGYSQVAAISDLLATSGFKAIAMSRFGYLRTPLPADASPTAQADAHACLLDALHVSKAAAVGLSAGAPSAIQYCLRHPARCPALVLLVPAISVPGRDVAETTPPSPYWQLVFDYVLRSDFVIWAVTRIRPEILVETVLATPLEHFRHASPAERQRGLSAIRDIFPVSLKADGLRNDALVTTSTTAHHLERISAPTLAISAQDDLYKTGGGAKHVAERIAGARLILFSTGGHAWLGHDAEVRDELVTFLRGTSSQR